MLRQMVERVFMGWDKPLAEQLTGWLLAHESGFPGMLLVVPTAQSGRRLRESLAEAKGGVLTPPVVTPGSLLRAADDEVAADWVERLAWMDALEAVADWSDFEALFPEPPEAGGDWEDGFSREMLRLRHSLQEAGLTLGTASNKLSGSVESERWKALAQLEARMEARLRGWNLRDRSRVLAAGVRIPPGIPHIVLAGVVEMPPLLDKALREWQGRVTALIAAPESEQAAFSDTGLPLECWNDLHSPWPEHGVVVAADARQQAREALRLLAEAGTPSDEVALGAADPAVAAELARTFTRSGWTAFHPAGKSVRSGLARWWSVWGGWLHEPTLAAMSDLLGMPETGLLTGGKRKQKAETLAACRDRWMVMRTEDLRRRLDGVDHRDEAAAKVADELLAAADSLEKWREDFLREDFPDIATRLLRILARASDTTAEAAQSMFDWLESAAPLIRHTRRPARFWIELMVSEAEVSAPKPPDGRVIDVQGWLELFHEPGRHLVICGMNEGRIPATSGGEPWLGETSGKILGLIRDPQRAARDAYLFRAMSEARRQHGRVDVICGKTAGGGEALLPSRILLAAEGDELARRVGVLFREIEPADARLRRERDWRWQPPAVPPRTRLGVTSLRDYLACPFRYYLKHVLGMQNPEPDRGEWNQRDFGSVAHMVLENWGRDPDAREFSKTEAIHDWLMAELDQVVALWFGGRPPLAVRIQREALVRRFEWVARRQAVTRAGGWQVIDVERKIEIPTDSGELVAMIDRVDRHESSGQLRVIDYKTGKVDGVEKSHRGRVTANSRIPAHLGADSPALHHAEDKGKSVLQLWKNLQLPLYAAAWVARGEELPRPCYFTIGATESDTAIHEWAGFSTGDMESARECALWVARRIACGVFTPPADRVSYDEYRILEAGGTLADAVDFPD